MNQALNTPMSALPRVIKRIVTNDNLMTFDQAVIDSAGAFFVGQLERLDPTLNLPLYTYTWSRDIDVRGDISLGDELASFTLSTAAAAGGINANGKSWLGKNANQIQGLALDIGKTGQPLFPWAHMISATIPELTSAQQTGHDIVSEKFEFMQVKWNMDLDEQVYIGDTTLNVTGMFNNGGVTPSNVVNGGSGTAWTTKTPQQILDDINTIINAAWAASGYAVCPDQLRVPPDQFTLLTNTILSVTSGTTTTIGGVSVIKYLEENSVCMRINGRPLQILPVKWLTGTTKGGKGPGAAGADRMVAYTKEQKYVRFPKTDLVPGPMEYRALAQHVPYWARVGVVEVRYPETMAYADGI